MITRPRSRGILCAAIVMTVAGCGGTDGNKGGTGGATGGASGGSSGGSPGTGGGAGRGTGGAGTGGTAGSGGSVATGGGAGQGTGHGGSGGSAGLGGSAGSGGSGAAGHGGAAGATGGAGGHATGGSGPAGGSSGTCTASKPAGSNVSGTGPHKVTVETNSGPGINQGTIFRPTDLGGTEKYPILVWGEGGCSQDGLSNSAAMAEIASHGYFVIADGTPNGSGNRTQDRSMLMAMAAPLIGYIDWAIAENDKPCSAYYQSLATTKISANGFSCGGLMSQAMVLDPRVVTWGVNSSGMKGADQSYYNLVKTPVLFVLGGSGDVAYDGGEEGYTAISQLGVPVLLFSKALGHGGDLFSSHGGDFTKIDLAWLNWWLKDDETATGKGLLVGASCPYCSDSAWEYKSAHIP
jgi:hypothetical protein